MAASLAKLQVVSPKKKICWKRENSKANPPTSQQLAVILILSKKTKGKMIGIWSSLNVMLTLKRASILIIAWTNNPNITVCLRNLCVDD